MRTTTCTNTSKTLNEDHALPMRNPKRVRPNDEDTLELPSKRFRAHKTSTSTIKQAPILAQPRIVVDAPPYLQDFINELSVAVFWELARIISTENIDIKTLTPAKLQPLLGENLNGSGRVRKTLGFKSLRNADKDVERALDWEAKAIVEGSGIMLGSGTDHLTPYGGNVTFPAKMLWVDTGNGRCATTLTLLPLRAGGSCIFTRSFGSSRFLRVKLPPHTNSNDLQPLLEEAIRPIHILGRVYRFLKHKDDTLWYYMNGPDYVGAHAEKAADVKPGAYGLGVKIPTVRSLLEWWIPFTANRDQKISKLLTRIELGISETKPGILLEANKVFVEEDIEHDDFIFTDGCGVMSFGCAEAHFNKLIPNKGSKPAAYQIRLSTSKGLVHVQPPDQRTKAGAGNWLRLTKSMVKARHNTTVDLSLDGPAILNGLSILDAAHLVTNIVREASWSAPGRLGIQTIPILHSNGVGFDILKKLQAESVDVDIKDLVNIKAVLFEEPLLSHRLKLSSSIQHHGSLIFQALAEKEIHLGPGLRKRKHKREFEKYVTEMEVTSSLIEGTDEVQVYARTLHTRVAMLYRAVICGFDILNSEFFRRVWKNLVQATIRHSTTEFHITVPGSAFCMILPDFSGILEEGEISFNPPNDFQRPDGGIIDFRSGDVLVARHPALLPTDIRKVKLADAPGLRQSRGVIFFSTKGARPLADILSGGDYDGDEVLLIWEPAIVKPFKNADISLSVKPEELNDAFETNTTTVKDLDSQISGLETHEEQAEHLERYLAHSVGCQNLIATYNKHYLAASYLCGIKSIEARSQAHKFCMVMDAPKTSVSIKPEVLAADSRQWGMYVDPWWKERQGEHNFKKPKGARNIQGRLFPPLEGKRFILDRLAESGERLINIRLENFKRELLDHPITHHGPSGEFSILIAPWKVTATRWADSDQKEQELLLVKETVLKYKSEFEALHNRKEFPLPQRQEQMSAIIQRFNQEPASSDIPLLTAMSNLDLKRIRASCAYFLDYSKQGGGNSGFCWFMAFQELERILVDHNHPHEGVTLPNMTFKLMKPHRSKDTDSW